MSPFLIKKKEDRKFYEKYFTINIKIDLMSYYIGTCVNVLFVFTLIPHKESSYFNFLFKTSKIRSVPLYLTSN